MTTAEDRMEALSRAYLQAVAAACGLTFSVRSADYGIDATLHEVTRRGNRYRESGLAVDIQLKSTMSAIWRSRSVAYDLTATAYEDLIREVPRPRLLVLLALPPVEARWLRVSERQLRLGGAMYWVSLRGARSLRNSRSVRIEIPRRQLFTPADNSHDSKRTGVVMTDNPVIHIAPRHEFVILDRDVIGEDQLEAVELPAVTDFLTRHGWVPMNAPRPGRHSYLHPELLDDSGEPLRQYVVWGETGIRHLDTVARLLASLGIAHDLSPLAVYAELTAGVPAPAGV